MNTKNLLGGMALLVSSSTTFAGIVNVGGVIWDTDAINNPPSLEDFVMNGSIIEDAAFGVGQTVTGFGKVDRINSSIAPPIPLPTLPTDFCPGCELTFTFSMVLASVTPTGGGAANFEFSNLLVDFWVDHTPDYIGTRETAGGSVSGTFPTPPLGPPVDGSILWLGLELAPGELLTGTGTNIATGSDTGNGSALLQVRNLDGGLAAWNFDTNSQVNGADAVLSSSFQPGGIDPITNIPQLQGTFDLTADTRMPEPSSFALFGLALFGFASSRRKK